MTCNERGLTWVAQHVLPYGSLAIHCYLDTSEAVPAVPRNCRTGEANLAVQYLHACLSADRAYVYALGCEIGLIEGRKAGSHERQVGYANE